MLTRLADADADADVADRAEQPEPDDLVGIGHRDQRGPVRGGRPRRERPEDLDAVGSLEDAAQLGDRGGTEPARCERMSASSSKGSLMVGEHEQCQLAPRAIRASEHHHIDSVLLTGWLIDSRRRHKCGSRSKIRS
jgi:hypothetical protein